MMPCVAFGLGRGFRGRRGGLCGRGGAPAYSDIGRGVCMCVLPVLRTFAVVCVVLAVERDVWA